MRLLNIIGCGKVGKTLGLLFSHAQRYTMQHILNATFSSSQEAARKLQGTAVSSYAELAPADAFLLAVPDAQIVHVVKEIYKTNCIKTNTLVFHCSGALSSDMLSPLKEQGAMIASVHPVKSFSHPEDDIHYFTNTYCTIEGDDKACAILQKDFITIGANVVHINSAHKMLYHAATIFCSNYFVTLVETSLTLFEKIGFENDQALAILHPLMQRAIQQVVNLGTKQALTGPIARNDVEIVANQLQALSLEDEDIARAYQSLGKLTLKLAQKDSPMQEKFLQLQSLLETV